MATPGTRPSVTAYGFADGMAPAAGPGAPLSPATHSQGSAVGAAGTKRLMSDISVHCVYSPQEMQLIVVY